MPVPARTTVGAVGVVRRDDHVLLVLSEHRGWEPPGGYCEHDEFVVDGLRREVLEETGYCVEPQRLTGVYQCEREHPILTFVFLCAVERRTANPIEESLDVRWWPLERLSSAVTYRPHLLRLTDALDAASRLRIAAYTIEPFTVDRSVAL